MEKTQVIEMVQMMEMMEMMELCKCWLWWAGLTMPDPSQETVKE